MTGSTSRKPRLIGGDKGCNVSIASFPGSSALWAGSFTFISGFLIGICAAVLTINILNMHQRRQSIEQREKC